MSIPGNDCIREHLWRDIWFRSRFLATWIIYTLHDGFLCDDAFNPLNILRWDCFIDQQAYVELCETKSTFHNECAFAFPAISLWVFQLHHTLAGTWRSQCLSRYTMISHSGFNRYFLNGLQCWASLFAALFVCVYFLSFHQFETCGHFCSHIYF